MSVEFVNVETGVEILRDLASKEANQWHKSVYDPEWREWVDAKHRYEDAKKNYPIAMMRAEAIFARDAFCLQCGACIPPREGEGTCYKCDPVGALRNWIRQQIEIAAENTGPADDYSYQRDQGKLEILHELEDMLDT